MYVLILTFIYLFGDRKTERERERAWGRGKEKGGRENPTLSVWSLMWGSIS